VFTARYALSPYIEQTCFVFKGVIRVAAAQSLPEFEFEQGHRFFSYQKLQNRPWGPPIVLLNGYGGYFPGLKQPGLEVDYSLSTADVKNERSYISVPVSHRGHIWVYPYLLIIHSSHGSVEWF
jgi:hypothetical protein